MATDAQITANQANAQLSTGAVTPEGKATAAEHTGRSVPVVRDSKCHALQTGLTGRTVLLPTDDAELYAKHIDSFRSRFNPLGDAETELVQRIADTTWRLDRIPGLEAGIYAIGRIKMADLHAKEQDEQMRSDLIQAEIFLAYEKQFRNLQIQEARLRRNLEKDTAALKEMQLLRGQEEKKRLNKAAEMLIEAIRNGQGRHFDPVKFGFEFSIGQIEACAAQMEPKLLAAYEANKPRHLRNAA